MATIARKHKSTPIALRGIQVLFGTLGQLMPDLAGRLALRLFATPKRIASAKFDKYTLPTSEIVDVPFHAGVIRTYSWGEGPTVFCVHGWEGSSKQFKKFVQPLLDEGYRVTLIDNHAHGQSSGRRTNYILTSDALYAAIQQLGVPYAVIAHSFGTGSITLMMERFPITGIGKFILIAPVNRLKDMIDTFARVVNLPERARHVMECLLVKLVDRSVQSFDVEQTARMRSEPALIIHDQDDRAVPFTNAQTIASVWNGAEVMLTKGLGHNRILMNEQVIRHVCEFLR